jgi:ankyrin repeat protein
MLMQCGFHGSPLHAASYKGNLDTVRLLLAHGVDINTIDKGRTPLRSAYDGGHLDVMRLLLEHGADADAQLRLVLRRSLSIA